MNALLPGVAWGDYLSAYRLIIACRDG